MLAGRYDKHDREELVRAWVRDLIATSDPRVPLHDTWEIRHTNSGVKVIWRRWAAPQQNS